MKVYVLFDKDKVIYGIYRNESMAMFAANNLNEQKKEGSPYYIETYMLRDDY